MRAQDLIIQGLFSIVNILLYFNFVVTPRNFIIAIIFAIIKLRGVTTKLKYNIFHHANFQGTKFFCLYLNMPSNPVSV